MSLQRSMLRAAAAPVVFLERGGFARFLAEPGVLRRPKDSGADLGIVLPKDLACFLDAVRGGTVADFVARPTLPKLSALITAARKGGVARTRLVALLAGAIPFGETTDGEVLAYLVSDDPAGAQLIATVEPPGLVCRGAAELAVICMMHANDLEAPIDVPGIAEEGAFLAAAERGALRADLLLGSDAEARAAAKALAKRVLDVPPVATTNKVGRSAPLAFGAIVEAFFRGDAISAHEASADRLVAELARHLATSKDAAERRRSVAAAKVRRDAQPPKEETTRLIVDRVYALPFQAEAFGALQEREETLLALSVLGDRAIVPELRARAVGGDATAVEMLAVLGDRELAVRAVDLLASTNGETRRVQPFDVALVRYLAALDVRAASPTLRRLLETSPLSGWRAGIERAPLVMELVTALGDLGDDASAPHLLTILESKSQEYRSVIPLAATALGRLKFEPALPVLERIVLAPMSAGMCEAIWAVGEIGRAHPARRAEGITLLAQLRDLEAGAEAMRVVALAKIGEKLKDADLRKAIDRALEEPGFRQDETSRRRAWGFRALEDLAGIVKKKSGSPLAFDWDGTRYWVTRDDHRVRRAAEKAFAAWAIPVPKARPYFAFGLTDDVDALLEAVKDPLGIFKHNIAARLAQLGDKTAVRALAEMTARLFDAPVTSTYEYDDAPPPLVAFVSALAKLNDEESNTVLLEGLRSSNHQVRAVVAENAPDDARFVPELTEMLGDPRSFLRSRAEKSLTTLGVIQPHVEPMTTEIGIAPPLPLRLDG